MRERCVIFVDNDKAKSYGSLSVITLDEPLYAYTTISDGTYPITPMDIRDHYDDLPVSAGMAIIEVFVERDSLGMISEFNRHDIISVNLNKGNGLLVPYRMFWPSCMFRKDMHIFTDVLGWDKPMPGLTLLRNKQCMAPDAYVKLRRKLANGNGAEIEAYIEKLMMFSYLDAETIEKYKL